MKIGPYSPSQIRKAIVAFAGAIVLLGTSALEIFTPYMSEGVYASVVSIIGVVVAVGVFLVRNAPVLEDLFDDYELQDNPIE